MILNNWDGIEMIVFISIFVSFLLSSVFIYREMFISFGIETPLENEIYTWPIRFVFNMCKDPIFKPCIGIEPLPSNNTITCIITMPHNLLNLNSVTLYIHYPKI